MAPGTNIGAATPVQLGSWQPFGQGDEKEDRQPNAPTPADTSERKLVNDAIAYIRSLAELHGRNAGWAKQAVRDSASLSAQAAKNAGVIEIPAPLQ